MYGDFDIIVSLMCLRRASSFSIFSTSDEIGLAGGAFELAESFGLD